MSDGASQGIGAERAIKTILGGEPAPEQEEERSPAFWLERLKAKDDNIGGYEAHAEVMAKYMVLAIEADRTLEQYPISTVYKKPTDWNNPEVITPDLSDVLKERVYTDAGHPFRRALSAATGFTWGWAYNIARYALGLPQQPNPAIITIG